MLRKNKIIILSIAALGLLFLFNQFSPGSIKSLNDISAAQKGQKVLVVVAHPDDEVIGPGGFIADSIKNGAEVKVVIVSNGDANLVSGGIVNKEVVFDKQDFINEGKLRMNESKNALKIAGVPNDNIIFLSFPDRYLYALLTGNYSKTLTSKYTGLKSTDYDSSYKKGVQYTGQNLTNLLKEIIAGFGPDIMITHSPLDRNRDHSSVYEFVRKARTGKASIYSFIVHFRGIEFPSPFLFRPSEKLSPPKALDKSCGWALYPLSQNTENVKYKEIKEYKTQLKDPGLWLLLRAFVRTNELFCVNP